MAWDGVGRRGTAWDGVGRVGQGGTCQEGGLRNMINTSAGERRSRAGRLVHVNRWKSFNG